MKLILLVILVNLSTTLSFSQELAGKKVCFDKFIGLELTSDVKGIYCQDSIYNGSEYQMTFICNKKTLKKIVDKFDLVRIRKFNYKADAQHLFNEYTWWQHDELNSIDLVYKNKTGKHRRWIIIWYNKEIGQLYFALYDL